MMQPHGKPSLKHPKYIFISGGVLSGLGKGVTAASLGVLLKAHGYSVTNIKCENYLNIDSGNINPVEHGDVFLCEDGLEADLDLGSYERFLEQEVGAENFVTMGQIYSRVINKTKDLHYDGATVDAIPYIPEAINQQIKETARGHDVILIELGGTAGEYQNVVYYEAYRILKLQHPEDVVHIHVTYFPKPPHIGELKSKPTQLSVKMLNGMGIQPDMVVGRAEDRIDDVRKEKVAFYCNLDKHDVISNPDSDTIYRIPLILREQKMDERILEKLGMEAHEPNLSRWEELVEKVTAKQDKSITIGIIAKYIAVGDDELVDSYKSLIESLQHAGWEREIDVKLEFINAEALGDGDEIAQERLEAVDGIIVPIGWGSRGVDGKMNAITYAREEKIPYLGLCYGMQLACVEYARNVVGLEDAHSIEVDAKTDHPIIHDIPFSEKYQTIKGDVASMRLGAYDCVLDPDSLAYKLYDQYNAFKDKKKDLVSERHRHRFEFNNEYREQLSEAGFIFSGTSPDDMFVEMVELPQDVHPFFLATQAHPEYKSRPLQPHPFFLGFLEAVETAAGV